MSVLVLGAGGWGTALAVMLARHGTPATLWARRADFAAELRGARENRAYLPGVPLPDAVTVTEDLGVVSAFAWALVVVPSRGVEELLGNLPRTLGVVLCAKGLAEDGARLTTLAARLGFTRVAVLSGPNHAEEVARGLPAATVVASSDAAFAQDVQRALMTPSFRVYTSADVVGVELGGVLKNVMAVAGGLVDGLRLGDNAKAAILTRGLREMGRYLIASGADDDTLYGLSGLGDLIATATSVHSRNRAAGEAIARGEPPVQGGKVAEGVRTAGLLADWAQAHGHDLPITRAVARVVAGTWTPPQALASLMERGAKPE
ncbi:NAD(P)H-dependent glycerol-3-phosphate dehydrogenase [Deinococcus maricopensis]|uniref:Glycerol-3-phosphate dehydrogenase [NAD(P)+] n=1 Tax=Deinococcus maricopensis (strain DSM 21211 / LMG 22137 / NRRL B-23946 / LB-34) TaxID=709986 RepID=E8U595_DEIML|nr:NAD(P)H-dependent glycerol-3-phosphate dehydrogenase [Deinococcus maricopensis]ADV66234.1 Glycerol-3-phosphate dehydrogenase (NAD(P)+) [Deinococcus maricopensis DSM 21211]